MSIPVSVHGNEYFEHLRSFRDLAFQESHTYGRRRHIGHLGFGAVKATWRSEADGLVTLREQGLRWGSTTISPVYQTTLLMFETIGAGECITEFKMDLDDSGLLKCRMIPFVGDLTMRTLLRAEFHSYTERRHGLDFPSDEQRELLYTEMQRGATCMYTFGSE